MLLKNGKQSCILWLELQAWNLRMSPVLKLLIHGQLMMEVGTESNNSIFSKTNNDDEDNDLKQFQE